MAVVGLGIDICSIERIRKVLEGPRGSRFCERVFTDTEQAFCKQRGDAAPAYAARFAAKEALVKALGAPRGMRWREIEVIRTREGAPAFALTGVAAEAIAQRKCATLLSLTHDAGVAVAVVILEAAR
jgi:holo-[acyl-carrier protein] synthase